MPARWLHTKEHGRVRCEDAVTVGIPGLFVNHALVINKAIDKEPRFDEEWWTITHRWSGLMIIGIQFSRKRDAIRVAKKVTERYDIDWDIRDPDELKSTYPKLEKWIRRIVEKHVKGETREK